jgi:hypothetical protein
MLSRKHGGNMGRKLTLDEIRAVEEYARQKANPKLGEISRITVTPELDDEGKTHFTTLYMTETVLPKDWKP